MDLSPGSEIPLGAGVHFGTRFVFDKGYIYFVIGERGGMMEAQDLTRPNGKIYRLHDDGRVPEDNPFVKDQGRAFPASGPTATAIPQGLAMDPRDGALYSTEHGPRGGDELNLIQPGANYGWPVITYGMNYDGTPMVAITEKEGMEQPLAYWVPSIAVCGLDFVTGDKFSEVEERPARRRPRATGNPPPPRRGPQGRLAGNHPQKHRPRARCRDRARRSDLRDPQRTRPPHAAGAGPVKLTGKSAVPTGKRIPEWPHDLHDSLERSVSFHQIHSRATGQDIHRARGRRRQAAHPG